MTDCKACGKAISFEQNKNGKWVPVNEDGTNHFETCPEANKFRNKHSRSFDDYNFKDRNQKSLNEYGGEK